LLSEVHMIRFSLKAMTILILLTVISSKASAFILITPINESTSNNDNSVSLMIYKAIALSDTGEQHSSEEDEECCQIECQDSHCICFDNLCSSVVFLSGIDFNYRFSLGNDPSFIQPFDQINRIQSYLYRPPIVSL